MKKKLLKYLCCPNCKNDLKINDITKKDKEEIIKAVLKCKCGCKFPVKEGLPRMYHNTSEGVKKVRTVFSKEWDLFDYTDEDDTWLNLDEGKRRKRVLTAFNVKPEDLKGKVILDAGCGNGRLSYNMSKFGCEVVALDLSSGVENASEHYKEKNLHYIQGDLMNVPLKPNSFDYIWSAGVLMETPSTKKAFGNLVPLVKKGGTLYVWVYGWPKDKVNIKCILWWSGWRFIMIWPDFMKEFFCCLYVPSRVLKESILLKKPINARSARQKRRAFYDNINPYMYHHSPCEVESWYKSFNFKDMEVPIEDYKTFCGYGIRGIKK